MVVISYFCHMDNATPLTMPADAKLSFDKCRQEVLSDYRIACISREASLLGRKEELTGKAKFGIFGDGKEIAQVATFLASDQASGVTGQIVAVDGGQSL